MIDFDGIDQRIVALPVPPGEFHNLEAGAEGQIYYLEQPRNVRGTPALRGEEGPLGAALKRFDLTKRKSEQLTDHVGSYIVSANHKKALVFNPPESWSIIDTSGAPPAPGKGKLKIDAVEVRIDPRAEWAQIFDEAWRINRDYFYDPGMHGSDWPAMKRKYLQFLPHRATRGDLDRRARRC